MLLKYLNLLTSPRHVAHRANISMERKFTTAVGLAMNWWEFHRSSAMIVSGQSMVLAVKVKTITYCTTKTAEKVNN